MTRQYEESERSHGRGYQFAAVARLFLYRFDHRPIPPNYGTSTVFEFGPAKNGFSSGAPEKPATLGACTSAP